MNKKVKYVLPNIITISRALSLVLGFILFIKGNINTSICLYIYGSVSDCLDGCLARRWNAYTKLGAYLDAIIDKFYALSIIIISVMYRNYSIILVAVLELIISIVNYFSLKKNGNTYTERVGKFKMTFEFILLIVSLITIKIKYFGYLYIVLLILTMYFQIQSINAYINQMNNKKSGLEIEYKGKKIIDKIKLLFKEFKYYLIHPVKIIK